MEANVGGKDRTFRGILALVLGLVGLKLYFEGRKILSSLSLATAVGFAFNYFFCFCTLNKFLGIDTSQGEEPVETEE
ncbi:MAG: YgaP-like transmembrane domain [Halobacteria archaeon]